MVNIRIVSRFTGTGPPKAGANLSIPGGPLYPKDDVLGLIAEFGTQATKAVTEKCVNDLQKWHLNSDDLHDLITLALKRGRYLGSEWCIQKPRGPYAACDAYLVSRMEPKPHTQGEWECEYYLKFAISKTGRLLLIISCHPPEQRN